MLKQIVNKIQTSSVAGATKRAVVLVGAVGTAALPTFAATIGRLGVTQAIQSLSGEFNGPLAYGVGSIGLCMGGLDLVRHREMGALGWSGAVMFGGAAFAMTSSSLLGMVPGAAAFLV